jgi:branched-chain amino acid transport system substrate-binding protein
MKRELGVLSGAILLLAGCGGAAAPASSAPAASAPAPASASAAKPAASAPASVAASAKPAASAAASASAAPAGNFDGTLLLGAPLSLTGSTSNEGKLTQEGYDIWADTVNAKGGVNVGGKHYQVQIKYYDDQSKQDQSALLTDRLISQDKVNFMLGPYGTPSTFSASAIAEKNKVPMVVTAGAAQSIFDRGFKYVFGIISPGVKYLTGVEDAWLAQTPKPTKLAVLSANDAFSLEVGKAAANYANEKGLQVVYNQSYPADTKDLSSALNQVKADGADVLLGSGHLDDSLVLMKQLVSLDLNMKGIGLSVGPSTPEFAQNLGKNADYVFSGVQWVPEEKTSDPIMGSSQDYAQAFQKKYGFIPEYHNAEATAGGVILQMAIEKAGTLDRDKVRDALAATNADIFFGHVQFDSRGSNSDKPMIDIQLQNGGKLVPVWPQQNATGKILWPAPAWNAR